jgi:DNA-binding transcriptional LysR family regulator
VNLNNVDLNKLRSFFVVVAEGGVSPAARVLGVTRSAVSQSIAALEAAIGVRLFHRVGKRLVATQQAERLHGRFAEYQAMLAQTLAEVRNEDREVRGLVRIGVFLGFPRPTLARFIAGFLTRHPGARLQVRYGSQGELRDRLLRGRIDLALSFRPSLEPGGKIRSVRLFAQELVLVSGRRHFRRDFRLEHLRTTPVIDYYPSEALIDEWVRHHFRKRSVEREVRAWAATTDLVLELVLAQAGIGVLPRALVTTHVARRRLFVITTGKRELVDAIWLNELAGSVSNHTLDVFRTSLLEELAVADRPRDG